MRIADDLMSLSAILTLVLLPLWWFNIIDIDLLYVALPMACASVFSLVRFIWLVFFT